jgi:hypothetical protein
VRPASAEGEETGAILGALTLGSHEAEGVER